MAFVRVCAATELPVGSMRRFDIQGVPVAVYNVGGSVHATTAICSHAQADLTEGVLDGTRVSCPLHGARFDVTTGRVLSPPAFKPLRRYPARLREGEVEVELA